MSIVLRLILARLRRRAASAAAIVAAVAAGAATLLAVFSISLVAEDSAFESELTKSRAGHDSVQVELLRFTDPSAGRRGGLPDAELATVEQAFARLPRSVVSDKTLRSVLFASPSRQPFGVAGVDRFARQLEMVDGDEPRACRPSRCEAVLVGARPAAGPRRINLGGLEITTVGRARFRDDLKAAVASVTTTRLPFLVVHGLEQLQQVPTFQSAPRRYIWTRPIVPGSVHPWGVKELERALTIMQADLAAAGLLTNLSTPLDTLTAVQTRARAAAHRLLLVAAIACAMLIAFAFLVATAHGADIRLELDRLAAGGAHTRHLVVFIGGEAAMLATTGIALGTGIASVGTLVLGELTGAGGRRFVEQSVLGVEPLVCVAALWLTTSLALASAAFRAAGRVRPSVLDVSVLLMLVILVWQGAERGALDVRALAGSAGVSPEVLLLPALVALATGLLALRAIPPVLKRVERVRRLPTDMRFGLLALTRDERGTGIAAAFTAAVVALGLFALSYDARLSDNISRHAAFVAGADLRVREDGPGGETAFEASVLPFERYRRLRGTRSIAAIRTSGEMAAGNGTQSDVAVLGLPAAAVSELPSMRLALGAGDAARAAAQLEQGRSSQLLGPAIPARAQRLRMTFELTGSSARLSLPYQTADGQFGRIDLGEEWMPGRHTGIATVPVRDGTARLLGIEVIVAPGSATSPTGTLELGPIRASMPERKWRAVADFGVGPWRSTGGAELRTAQAEGATLRYPTSGGLGIPALRYQPTALGVIVSIPAVVSESVAAQAKRSGGTLPGHLPGGELLRIRPIKAVEQAPTLGSRFAIVDATRLSTAVNAQSPGALVPGEAWITLEDPAREAPVRRQLASTPFRDASITSAATIARAGEGDPFARAVGVALQLVGILALLTAVCGTVIAVQGVLRDRAPEFVEIEALGVPPSGIRRQLRCATGVVLICGAVIGTLGAVVLCPLVTSALRISADARNPFPPVDRALAWLLAAEALVVGGLVVTAVVLGVTHRALRGSEAGRLGG